jgi:enoyl-CoA hydratase/carnithine racemase
MSEHVRIEKKDGVLTITLARPDRRNAISVAMYAALAEALESAARDPAIRAILFRGEGKDFAAGNDLADFLDAAARSGKEIPVWRFLRALAQCQTPMIAAVHGNCVGIGTTMLLHCDLVIAEEGVRFSLPFVDLGLVPEAASSLLLPRLAGRRLAARYLLLAEPFGLDEAVSIGLVSHRAQSGELHAETSRVITALLAKPPEALIAAHRLLRHGTEEEPLQRMLRESVIFAKRLASSEARQAISAFFARKKTASGLQE